MKKNILFLIIILLPFLGLAQVAISTDGSSPNSNAMLEVKSATRGFLPSRVALTSTTSASPLSTHVEGMMVYNTASTGDVTPGLYINDGTKWLRLCTSCIAPETSTNGTAVVSSFAGSGCTGSGSISGTMHSGVAVSGVTMTLYANVTQVGTWSLSATNNGVTFAGSGAFTATGCQAITLTATGTPTSGGSYIWATNSNPAGSASSTVILTGILSTLDCAGATHNGTLYNGTTASGVSSVISYTGGNGGVHDGQTVTSTGVTGLTATLSADTFASGAGTLIYTITGTPASTGTASFAINIGGQSCTLTRTVNAEYHTTIADVTNPTTGRIWMDRNLGATQVATSSTDTNAYGSLYQWGRGTDGHQIRTSDTTSILSSSDTPGHGKFIVNATDPYDWRSPQNTNLWQGVSGTNNPCPSGYRLPTEVELDAERASWSSNNATGAFNSVLKLTVGGSRMNDGSFRLVDTNAYYWSSTINGNFSRRLLYNSGPTSFGDAAHSWGMSVRCIKDNSIVGSISTLDCSGATSNGTLTSTIAASGVSSVISYTGGNGGTHDGQTVTSTGVTGLTAKLSAGTFASGAGTLTYTITGAPLSSGTASFAINIGGQTCTLTRTVDTFTQVVVDVTNPTTGKTWMDRNLGATQAATSSTDGNAYGYLYQWGRGTDGHQIRTSDTTYTLSSSDTPGHGKFILNSTSPTDWRSSQNDNLWQGTNGVNNPCPSGYRLPTETELNAERTSWSSQNAAGALASVLKLPMGGHRSNNSGGIANDGLRGNYWSSTVSGTSSRNMTISSTGFYYATISRSTGFSVRCIRDNGVISTLDCSGATNNGTLTSGVAASGVSSVISYTGGNGLTYYEQNVSSTGVTGLTATLAAGTFASGAGTLTYTITGTPASSGTASFAINIGGQSCTLTRTVDAFTQIVVDVTNPTTGKTWMDRNLGAPQAATSVTDASAYGSLYQWGRGTDGHQIRSSATTATLSSSDTPGHGNFILSTASPHDWRSTQNNNLWQGTSGVNNPCPTGYRLPTDAELNAERASFSSQNAAGAFASVLKLTVAGRRHYIYNGSIYDVNLNGFYWTSTVSDTNSRVLVITTGSSYMSYTYRAFGCSVRCIRDNGTIGTLDCSGATNNGTLTSGVAASGVSSVISYTGGNGLTYYEQNVSSTGVTGLTATLAAGTFASGAGTLTYTIIGTPASSGTASFAINIGGQSCTLTRTVDAFTQIVVDVTNPTTGKTWMDRNLGAPQAATSSTDANAYGYLFQWGRGTDGHQIRTSATTATLSSSDTPGHGNFILSTASPYDWRSTQNNNLWQGTSGVNNPCPTGYRLPTDAELNAERTSWSSQNAAGAYASVLKLPAAGYRSYSNGSLTGVGSSGTYWSGTALTVNAQYLDFSSSNARIYNNYRAYGFSVRCIKD